MDCLGNNGISCKGGKQRKVYKSLIDNNFQVSKLVENEEFFQNSFIQIKSNSILHPYSSSQLRTYHLPGELKKFHFNFFFFAFDGNDKHN